MLGLILLRFFANPRLEQLGYVGFGCKAGQLTYQEWPVRHSCKNASGGQSGRDGRHAA